ncbi:Bug family tripartite tricarboxylate transporter substrate binding protein [Ramlibacter sp. AN1015]|uniref:Bug family tripartite tricarboxylate transporter substrate binding protein n=1 Tax=Ramlibacter sp. AN1015 TaxID=3133428 RepID=UPI0030BD2D0A
MEMIEALTTAISRRGLLRASLPVLAAAAGLPALAQARLQLATITTGFPAGGSSDVTARLLAEHLRGRHAETVLVENKPGASGRIAVEHVKAGAADGSSLLLSPSGMMVLFPHIYRNLRYEPLQDFAPVTPLAKFPFVLAISDRVPASVQSLPDFLAWAKANSRQASFGSPGAGTSAHFSGIMLGRRANIEYTHVPYKGMAPLVQDLLGGQIASGVLTPGDALPVASKGRLRLLATTGSTRSRFMPQVPTYTELGFPEILIEESYSLYAPAAVPAGSIQQIATLSHGMLEKPDVQERFTRMGLEPARSSPAEFRQNLRALHERWGRIVRESGFTPTE